MWHGVVTKSQTSKQTKFFFGAAARREIRKPSNSSWRCLGVRKHCCSGKWVATLGRFFWFYARANETRGWIAVHLWLSELIQWGVTGCRGAGGTQSLGGFGKSVCVKVLDSSARLKTRLKFWIYSPVAKAGYANVNFCHTRANNISSWELHR